MGKAGRIANAGQGFADAPYPAKYPRLSHFVLFSGLGDGYPRPSANLRDQDH